VAEDHRRAQGGGAVRHPGIGVAFACVALTATAQAAPQPAHLSIEQRLERAEDEIAIRRILIDYHWNMDMRDFDAYAALFAKEGVWTSGDQVHQGPAAIKKMMIGIFGEPKPGQPNRRSIEITTNPEITIDGDHAKARSRHLLVWRGADGSPQPMLAGRYEDDLIHENGQWKILKRIDFPVMPTIEEWGAIMRARAAATAK
jgi:ketosteroid isomerase-like protein